MEFGVFTDEGAVATEFYSKESAEAWLASNCEPGEAHVAEVCHDHPEHERDNCELCNADEEGEGDA